MGNKKEPFWTERDLFIALDNIMGQAIEELENGEPNFDDAIESEGLARQEFTRDFPGKQRHTRAAAGVPQFGGGEGARPRDLRDRINKKDPGTLPGPVIIKGPAQK